MGVVQFPSGSLVKWGLVTQLRKNRSFWALAFFIAIGMAGALLLWPDSRSRQMASISREMLAFVAMLFMGEALLLIPGMAATSVTLEKEQDTFDQLWLTLIRPGSLIAAKMINVLGIFYLFFIAALPIAGSIFFLIGVDGTQIAAVFGLVAATAFSCAAAGILCSAYFRKSVVATIASYCAMLFLSGILPHCVLLLFLVLSGISPGSGFGLNIVLGIQVFSPLFSLAIVIEPRAGMGGVISPWYSILYQLGWSLVCFYLARRCLLKPANPPKVEWHKPIDDSTLLERRRRQFPFYLIDPLRRKPSIPPHRNPMLVKELRWGIMGRAGWLIRIFYGAFIVYMATAIYVVAHVTSLSGGDTMPFVVIQMVVTILVIPPLMANSMAKEYEMGNMDFLRSTLLTPSEIMLGKIGACIINLGPLLLASLCSGAVMAGCILLEMSLQELAYQVAGYGTLATCVILSFGIGIGASVFTRRTTTALLTSYSLTLLIYVVVPLILIFEDVYYRSVMMMSPGNRSVEKFTAFFSPISAYLYAPMGTQIGRQVEEGMINIYWLGNVVLFSLIGLGLLAVAFFRFARSGMKDK